MSEIKFWKYFVPPEQSIGGWGIFLLDSTGFFSCVTDYGNFAFNWPHHGEESDFRSFFAYDKHFDYHVKKLYLMGAQGELEFDAKETIKFIKETLIRARREDFISEEDARKEWDLLEAIDWDYGLAPKQEWYDETDLTDAYELFIYDYPPHVKGLRDKLLPRFAKMLREELEKEKALSTEQHAVK